MLAIKAIFSELFQNYPRLFSMKLIREFQAKLQLKWAKIMKEMSKTMQVFAITHLPQIAAKGNLHYKVIKRSQGETTISELLLSDS